MAASPIVRIAREKHRSKRIPFPMKLLWRRLHIHLALSDTSEPKLLLALQPQCKYMRASRLCTNKNGGRVSL